MDYLEQTAFWLAYIEEAMTFANPDTSDVHLEARAGLVEEVGELCGLYKRFARDGAPLDCAKIEGELGDILWYIVRVVHVKHPGGEYRNALACAMFEADLMHEGTVASDDAASRIPDVALELLYRSLSAPSKLHLELNHWRNLCKTCLPGRTIEQIATTNLEKLRDRKARGVITGKGDNR